MINNKTNQRELCYVVTIDDITPLEGYDRVELAHVGGWVIVVGKDNFKPGDLGVYFEIDSKLPMVKPFVDMEFLAKKKFRIKTQKMCGVISQGLLMSASDFGGELYQDNDGTQYIHINGKSYVKGDFLTETLGVTYASAADNERKKRTTDKYKRMSQRLGAKANTPFYKWMYQREWGKKVLYLLYGKKKDNPKRFPNHFPYIKPTDQERCENMVWVLEDKTPYIVTQKCDGSSATYILERKRGLFGDKFEYYVCSRNVRQFNIDQQCYHDENYYWMASYDYNIKECLEDYLTKNPELDYVCIQGELCGPKIQSNPHKLSKLHFYAFHMIDSKIGKYDIRDAKKIWDEYGLESVPIICDDFIMPDNFEDFKKMADGFYDPSVCEGQTKIKREGFVYYKTSDSNFSFKNVSRQYLIKH